MSDESQALLWAVILVGGLSFVVALRKADRLATTHARDLLHIGAGSWVFGLPFWHSAAVPIAITVIATILLALVPLLAPRLSFAAAIERSVTGADERWSGLVFYSLSFAVMTFLAFRAPFPAAAALLALALGDGIGGLVGRRFGRHFFAAPWGKRKSLEGSASVAIAAAVGGWLGSVLFAAGATAPVLIGIGVVASVAEALAPRTSDNVVVPAAVYLYASALMSPAAPAL